MLGKQFPNTVDDFLLRANGERKVRGIVGGQMPDVTAAQLGAAGGVAAAGIAGYALGMRGMDYYVFLVCSSVFASVVVLCDALIRGKRNDAQAAASLSGIFDEDDEG